MIITTDTFGDWYQLGFIKPDLYNNWYQLTPEHEAHSGAYRFTFECKNFEAIRSYIWVRSVFVKDGRELYSQSRKVYPQPVPLRIQMSIPPDLIATGVSRQKLQCKKLLKYRYSTDFMWSVRIEELYIEPQESENTFLLTLTNVVRSQALESDPDLWVTTFEESTGYNTYEVGRFYTADTNRIVSDPIVETYPNLLRTTFTSKQPVQPNTIKVRLVA